LLFAVCSYPYLHCSIKHHLTILR